ncbi:sensor histidine kinase [Agrobacterium arsenijevicii]|uniref:histidine kinase n=1 Tax=Agrobacterium arsenijevicii TaxID=1585697 RepID=A0ABR5D692_9HYPH|nr:histidine kinase [Agrobacterium arsenijevicii]
MRARDLPRSLHARIISFIAFILTTGAVVLSLAAWQYADIAAREAYDKLLIGGAIQIAENVFVQGGVVTLDPPVAALSTLSSYDQVFYRVIDPRGVTVAGYADLTSPASAAASRQNVVLNDGLYQGLPVRFATISRMVDAPDVGGWSQVVVAQTVHARAALSWDLTLKAFTIIAVMSFLALLAGAFSVRFALAPLVRIEREIAARQPDDMRPIDIVPPLEVRALVSAIDEFMRRLSERIAVMQRFIADAAHQIRTPLAALDARLELLTNDADPADHARQIEGIREKSGELARLTSQLLGHAMIIHRTESVRFDSVDLNALAKSVLAQTVPLAFEREVAVLFSPAAGGCIVQADAISICEALANLIHNALTHGAASRLGVTVGFDNGKAWIIVSDDGPGIPASEWARLCSPFQVGAADGKGSGLGLAIASDVAKGHGGSLEFGGEPGRFDVKLIFPGSH